MNFAKKSVLLAASALSAAYTMPAFAQDSADAEDSGMGNDIVVTARRSEEKLQDVPISITVLSAEKLANNNITSAKDLATYTPGLTTNNRFGSDNTTWTIRGFTQEQRTSATVGTFFNDVVAPRGSGATQGGDGAGPGMLFDLANVQVLKGPQGTLQGRNSTGGAVLLVPRKPTDKLEGYLEAQAGDYNMFRVQGVVNVPLSDTVRVRVGFDRQKRDGYLQNVGKVGFGPNGDSGGSIDYWAARAGIAIDLTPDLENYTVANWSRSKSTGLVPKMTAAFYRDPYSGPAGVTGLSTNPLDGFVAGTSPAAGVPVSGVVTANGLIALNQMAYEKANCASFWCVSNPMWDSRSDSRTWQAINTTTWKASDSLTVKGILSYGEFRGDTSLDLFGLYNPRGAGAPTNAISFTNLNAVTTPLGVRSFAATRAVDNLHTNAESSFVAELQFQGHGENFNWQGGFYLENSNPLGKSGTSGPSQTPCGPIGSVAPTGAAANETIIQTDTSQVCLATPNQANSLGRVGLSLTENSFRDKAIYWQGILKLTDKLKFTAGIRYTWDEMRSDFQLINLRYYTTAGGFTPTNINPNTGLVYPPLTNVQSTGFNGVNLVVPSILTPSTPAFDYTKGVGFCNNNVTFGYPANFALTSTLGSNFNAYSPGSATNAYFPAADALNRCKESHTVKTSAPTWLLGLDFKPTDNILLYAKYSRGYRQGGVASFALDQVQDYGKEKVDTFEIGAKTSWRGSMPGYFNVSAYHNNFRNQQLQIGIQCNPTANCPQTTAILNAGKSYLKGFEIEAGINPFEGFRLEASYAYLKTKLQELADVNTFITSRNNTLRGLDLRPLPIGTAIPNAQPHKLVLTASYTLPLDESIGKVTLGGTMVYSSKYRTVADPSLLAVGSCVNLGSPIVGTVPQQFNPATSATSNNSLACSAQKPDAYAPGEYGVLPGTKVFNLNLTWENVGSMPVDAAFFVTNVTNEKVFLHTNVQSTPGGGYITSLIGEPRMWGVRLKYRFGN